MNKNFRAVAQSIVITAALAISFTFAQGSIGSMSTATPNSFGFFGDMSVKVYCTFSNFVPGSDNSLCNTDIIVRDTSNNSATSTSNTNGTTTVVGTKINQINGVLAQGLSGKNARVVYVPVKGDKGDNGTTTIIYQTTIPGASQIGPTAYIYAGGNTNSNPYQTTVPGDIHSTFVHFLQSEIFRFREMYGSIAQIANITASTTNTTNLLFQEATGTNLTASGTITTVNLLSTNSTNTNSTSTNLYSTNASLTNATTTNLFAVFANIWDFYFHNATGTNLSITNLTSTGTFALASGTISSVVGNVATFTSATTTSLFATNASITNATTTYFFAAWANFLNLFVDSLIFNNATGTNLQVANASTTNLSATGTSVITNLNSSFATITNATTTNLFTTWFKALNARIDNLGFISATGTNLLLSSIVATSTVQVPTLNASVTNATTSNFLNAIGTNATITNATITNLRVTNCAEGNVVCNGGNDTGAVAGPDAPLTIGVLNAGNINFITGDLGFPSVTPGTTKLVIETGLGGVDGNGAVRVTNNLKVGADIVASGTITSTNLVATGTFALATGTIASTTIKNLNSNNIIGNTATFTSATTTNLFATLFNALSATFTNLFATNATFTNATTTSLFAGDARIGNLSAIFATTTNLIVTNVGSDLIPSASSTYNLGSLALPWKELFVSSSSVYIGGTRISNVNGVLTWGGSGINFASSTATSSSNFGTVNASTTNTGNLVATLATITSATTTNLFSSLFKSLNSSIDSLSTLNATFTSATTTNFSVTGILSSLAASFTNLLFANATGTNATTTNFFATGFKSTNTVIDNLVITNAITNATITNATSTNSFVTNLVATIAKFATLNFGSATGTSFQVGNGFATNLNATGTATFANVLGTNATITNATFTTATTTNFGWINATGSTLAVRFIEASTLTQDLNINTSGGGATVFKIAGAEKMRVDNTGFVGIGTNNPAILLHVSTTTSGTVARFTNSNGNCNVNPISGMSCSSDERLKKNINELNFSAVEKLLGVSVKEYNMINQEEGSQKQIGFIAQNLENIFPWLVQTDEEGYKSVSYGNFTPILVKAIQEMKTAFFSEKVTTNQLCIGTTCINESDLQQFKAWQASQGAPTPTPDPVPPVVDPAPAI